jgi:hypothetical protein
MKPTEARRGDAALSSQQSRRSERAPQRRQKELFWTALFFAAAVIGAVISHLLLHGHTPISWPLTLVIALLVAAAPAAAGWTGVLDERPPASKHTSHRATGPQPAAPPRSGRTAQDQRPSPVRPQASHPQAPRPPAPKTPTAIPPGYGGRRSGAQAAIPATEPLANRASGGHAVAPADKNPPPHERWIMPTAQEPQRPGAAPPTVPVMDPRAADTVRLLDPTGRDLLQGTRRPGHFSLAEAVIAQCPQCGSFGMDEDLRAGIWQFTCHECSHEWSWRPGTPWPTVQVRPDHARR